MIASVSNVLNPNSSSTTATTIAPSDSNIDAFGLHIENTLSSPDQVSALAVELENLNEGDRVTCAADYQHMPDQAYTSDVLGESNVKNEGCGDDGFDHSCDWLISRGRPAYEAAIAESATLVDTFAAREAKALKHFRYVMHEVFSKKIGRDISDFSMFSRESTTGTPFEEDKGASTKQYQRLSIWAGHACN